MDAIFKALNDPFRRLILDALRQKDGQTLSELEQLNPELSRFGVMKHLRVLEDAHLITTRRAGRFKHHHLNAAPLQEVIDRWIEPLLAKPAARGVLDLKAKLEKHMTPQTPDAVVSTYIRTTQDALWDALIKAEHLAAYHFASQQVEGDLAPGETQKILLPDGSSMLEMSLVAADPKTRLEISFAAKWAGDVPANKVVYLLEEQGDSMKLTVEHYDVPAEMSGVTDGWTRLLSGLKTYLETGDTVKFAYPQPAEA